MINLFDQSGLFAHRKIHLGISGSIACYKACDLLRRMLKLEMAVSAVLSAGAREFITPLLVEGLGATPVYGDMFAPGDAMAHLEPGRKAELMAIAPASADILAQLASGAAANMLAAQFLAFPGARVIAPAMNPRMWANAATQENIAKLLGRGCRIVAPGVGGTACGEEGQGRMAEIDEIFFQILYELSPKDLSGKKVMVTLGPTRELWDGARFWSNPSSGRMGAALCSAAWLRGAEVHAICGPNVHVVMPLEIKRANVTSAREMFAAASDIWPQMDMGIFSAAVADFSPIPRDEGLQKFKKDSLNGKPLTVEFSENPDILDTLSHQKHGRQKVLGFAAETPQDIAGLLPLARLKLKKKAADVIAANMVNDGKGAFGADSTTLAVVDAKGNEQILPTMPKIDAAWKLISWLLQV